MGLDFFESPANAFTCAEITHFTCVRQFCWTICLKLLVLKKPPRFVTIYHDKGKKKICYFEVNGQKHGPYEKYNQQEQLVLKRNYEFDLIEGYEFEYYPYTGKVCRKTKYHLGKRNGKHWIRTSRGFWVRKCAYQNDLLHGNYREWYEGTHILRKGCMPRQPIL